VLAVVIGTNLMLWQYANWVQPLAAALLLIGGLFVFNMSYGYFAESRRRRQFAELFGQYVPPELVRQMSRNPDRYSMEGRRAELTVLFSDIRGFTTISEGMEPAQLMNEYLSAMTPVIRKHHGTLDKYMGDAIMAFWGAPVSDPNHARNAVVAALEMRHALDEFNRSLMAKGAPEIRIGIGINTGNMTVGDMGSLVRKAYTVMGDAVNLGSRLESITKHYGVTVIVGSATRHAIDDMCFRELDLVQVKGKEEPVAIFEPLGFTGQVAPQTLEELEQWNRALLHYRKQEWQQADSLLEHLLRMQPDCRLYALYRERIAELSQQDSGPTWNGVVRFDTK
jgi:adenylate cyclase